MTVRNSFAYLFERFPSFVQTFVYREAVEMLRQKMEPWLVSIRHPDDPGELAEHLDVDVFYAPEEKALRSEVDAQRAARKLSWRAHRAIPRHRSEPDAQRMFEAIWLAPHLRARGIRHVHAHFGGVAARTAWWLRELFGFSYSFTGHANDIFCDTDFPVRNAALVRGARFVITETDYARRWMETKYPRARGKVFRVFNGIDTGGFPPRQPPGPAPRIVSVGRYVEKKGFGDLIESCRLLRERGLTFECDIIGGGPLAETLREQIANSALDDCVRLLGPRPQNEVRQFLARADLFALACSTDREGGSDNLPTVIMEAMACGLPVVSTRIAGVPEMITDGIEGLLTPANDPPAFAAALERLLHDRNFASACGTKGRASAVVKFSVESTTREVKRLLVIYAKICPPTEATTADVTLPQANFLTRFLRSLPSPRDARHKSL